MREILGLTSGLNGWSTQACCAVREIYPEPAENVAEAIGDLLHEVEAARRDLSMTGFRLQQAEALRRFDRAKVSVAGPVQSRNRKKSTHRV